MKKEINVLRQRAKRNPVVLVVDDESTVLEVLDLALPNYGFEIKPAAHWIAAIDTYKLHEARIEFALIDVQMPECDGPMLLKKLRSLNSKLQACFMTGYAQHHSEDALLEMSGRPVLAKPFTSLDFVALTLWKMVDATRQ